MGQYISAARAPTSIESGHFSKPTDRRKKTSITYHLYSIWLFTLSDLKTIIVPKPTFGILNAVRASVFHLPPISQQTALARSPLVLLWTWINLRPLAINNQRHPHAIEEDRANKPWRPLPSGRLTPATAKYLMLLLYPVAVLTSVRIDGLSQCIALLALGTWYNNLGGADSSWLVRNLLNALGFVSFASGALEVALGNPASPITLEPRLLQWLVIIAAVVFSTVQAQDMYDQAGDALRGRKTAPLVLGDGFARWTIAVPVAGWAWFVPWFWGVDVVGYVLPMALGAWVAYRTLAMRTVQDDKTTFRLWNLWLTVLYLSPLVWV